MSDWKQDALCAGSDRWFTTEPAEQREMVGLCRNECAVYRNCLSWVITNRPDVPGVIAGLTEGGRDTIKKPATAGTLTVAVCRVCDMPFEFMQTRGGRKPQYCSEEHQREYRAAYAARFRGEKISA